MDRVQRHYARTALQGTDPLQGLSTAERRAILTMPPTIGERLRLAPWRNMDARRAAVRDIIAERRLAYSLFHDTSTSAEMAAPAPATSPPSAATAQLLERRPSPYYLHRLAMAQLSEARYRSEQDHLADVRSAEHRLALPAGRATYAAMIDVQIERARLDLKELELIAAAAREASPEKPRERNALKTARPAKSKDNERDR